MLFTGSETTQTEGSDGDNLGMKGMDGLAASWESPHAVALKGCLIGTY